MEKDTINDLFDDLKGEFDFNEPNDGHEQRFLNKLTARNSTSEDVAAKTSNSFNWKPLLAIAASFS